MAKKISRLGKGIWTIEYKGKRYNRKIQRKVVNGSVMEFVTINGKKIRI